MRPEALTHEKTTNSERSSAPPRATSRTCIPAAVPASWSEPALHGRRPHHAVEAPHLRLAAHGQLRAVVRVAHGDVQHTLLAVGAGAARLLDKEAERDGLVQQPQRRSLAHGGGRHEDAAALDQQLHDVHDGRPRVAQRELLPLPVIDELGVALVRRGAAVVGGREQRALLQVAECVRLGPAAVRAGPSGLLEQQELVHRRHVAQRDDRRRARPVEAGAGGH
mmetsp:Transcript_51183/g.123070  ORF Transcript_51183/g.123070 Transcript_51183/m.123070 type:complete len:222 (+) Transcript_51183:11-676(+)|eukprot:scaffold17413_cov72-Phaeocystis_antarctica.AAC.8